MLVALPMLLLLIVIASALVLGAELNAERERIHELRRAPRRRARDPARRTLRPQATQDDLEETASPGKHERSRDMRTIKQTCQARQERRWVARAHAAMGRARD